MTNHLHIQEHIAHLGITALNEMQQQMLDNYDSNKDFILLSPTGTGKTLAFLLPLITTLSPHSEEVQALVVVPSRELALQIEQVFKTLRTPFKINSCYGGHDMKTEVNNLSQPPAILVGTPGRLTDHIRRNNFTTDSVTTIILDEFDKSLQLGFEDEIGFIFKNLPHLTNRVLVSATNMKRIPAYSGIKDPIVYNHLDQDEKPKLTYKLVHSSPAEKLDTLMQLICNIGKEQMLVFCNHREAVDRISEILEDRGLKHGVFHGGMDQVERERTLVRFRNGSYYMLITTDLAARGLDIPEINHIIHYQLPPKPDAFTHRNGRTARMKAEGTVYLLMTGEDAIPQYIPDEATALEIDKAAPLPENSDWETLYVSAGKKDKVNKVDLVGLFLKTGQLDKNDLGLIEVKDKFSYVAVKQSSIKKLLPRVHNQKVKKQKLRIQIAR